MHPSLSYKNIVPLNDRLSYTFYEGNEIRERWKYKGEREKHELLNYNADFSVLFAHYSSYKRKTIRNVIYITLNIHIIFAHTQTHTYIYIVSFLFSNIWPHYLLFRNYTKNFV